MLRSHAKSINIGAFGVDSKTVGTEGEQLPGGLLYQRIRQLFQDRNLLYKLLYNQIELPKNNFTTKLYSNDSMERNIPFLTLLFSLKEPSFLQGCQQLIGHLKITFSRWVQRDRSGYTVLTTTKKIIKGCMILKMGRYGVDALIFEQLMDSNNDIV
jgi:hypothetical protein